MLSLELHLNPWFKWTSFKQNASCISSNSITSTCHVHASYCCICLCIDCRHRSFSIGPAPESAPEYLSEEQCPPIDLPGKQNPLVHSDTIPLSLAPALFYCIRTTTFQLLHAAVVKPLSSAWPVIATVNRWNPPNLSLLLSFIALGQQRFNCYMLR